MERTLWPWCWGPWLANPRCCGLHIPLSAVCRYSQVLVPFSQPEVSFHITPVSPRTLSSSSARRGSSSPAPPPLSRWSAPLKTRKRARGKEEEESWNGREDQRRKLICVVHVEFHIDLSQKLCSATYYKLGVRVILQPCLDHRKFFITIRMFDQHEVLNITKK